MVKSRDYYFDNAKFFLIILVVLGHAMEVVSGQYISLLYKLIYLFHMPAFVLVSGYFMKFQKEQRFSELVTQYLIFQTLYGLFNIYFLKKGEAINYATPYWLLWFFMALIIWKILTPHMVRLKHPIVITLIIAVLVGYSNSIGRYLSISRIITLFPFFLMGYYAEKKHFEKIKSAIHPVFAISLFAVSLVILMFMPKFHVGILYHAYPYDALNLDIWYAGIYRTVFLAWGGILMLSFFALIPTTQKVYSALGQRTLQVYILHGFLIKILAYYKVADVFTTPLLKIFFFLTVFAATLLLLLKPFQYVFVPITYLSQLVFASRHTTKPNTEYSPLSKLNKKAIQ